MKVLLADDSATIRMILKGLLRQLQITDVVEATDGKKAFDLAQQQRVDLIMLDIHMPNMDGLTCLKHVKETPETADTPVLIISSDTTPSQLQTAETLGARAFVQKPFRLDVLRQAISVACPQFVPPAA